MVFINNTLVISSMNSDVSNTYMNLPQPWFRIIQLCKKKQLLIMVKRLTMANIWLISSSLTSWSVMFTALLGQYMYQLRAWWRDWVRSSTFLYARDCRLSQSHTCFSTTTGHIPSFPIPVCLCISPSLCLLQPLSLSLSLFCLIPSLPFSHPLPFTVPFSVPFYVPFFHFVPPSLLQPLLPSVNKSDVTRSRKLLTVAASSPCSDSVTWCDKCDTVCCTKLTDQSRLCL